MKDFLVWSFIKNDIDSVINIWAFEKSILNISLSFIYMKII